MNSHTQPSESRDPDTGSQSSVLVVDDDLVIRTLLAEILSEDGYKVTVAEDGEKAIDMLGRHPFDMVISDIVMPGLNGVEVLLAAKRIDPDYPVVMVTGFPSVDTAIRLVNLGATDYISKPFNVDAIRMTVAKVLEMRRSRAASAGAPRSHGLDGLTRLCGVTMFTQILEKEIERSGWKGRSCSLLMADVAEFETSPASGGGSEGDRLLRMFATILELETRPGDTMGRTDRAELAVILPETDREEAETLVRSLGRKTKSGFPAKVGVACYPGDASNAERLIKMARAACGYDEATRGRIPSV